ncbi:hypothetical protein KFL_000900060 [Klebsormidium nitens]|uniref:Uncharacterized protein n=1 Tax=Klebsormidium nitens TaxID=105231 RepID=A0A0U9HJ19_KLENI|nr:hypothetical protein KFL_000900060 [Klebsormidium nitens]|eukprot:GAQ81751.1 hypothetical protein KFL_000900060 [Klebsormidium nitens]
MASAKYSFQVQIPKDADVTTLVNGGYELGVMKKSGVDSAVAIPVQWLSVEILGGTITVSWDEDYYLYYTTQDLSQDGVTIMQGSNTPEATMGRKYSYNRVFREIGSASRPDGIEIENDWRPGNDRYGIAQKVSKNGQLVQASAFQDFGGSFLLILLLPPTDPSLFPIEAPVIASGIPLNGTAGFSFAEEVEVYFTNSKKYTGNDGIVAKDLSVSASTSIVLKPGHTSAVAFDFTSKTWTPVAVVLQGIPLALAAARPPQGAINTLEELFAYEPALNVKEPSVIVELVVIKLAVKILGAALIKWIDDEYRQTHVNMGVRAINPQGVSTEHTLEFTNNGKVSEAQMHAAEQMLKGQLVPIPGGRYLAAPGVYHTLTIEDKILSVEVKKPDATNAALRLILAQMAAAKKASGLPIGTNGAYGGYLNNA